MPQLIEFTMRRGRTVCLNTDKSAFRKSDGKLFQAVCTMFGGQSASSCQRNAVVLRERLWPAGNHRQGIPGHDRTKSSETIYI